MNSPNGTNADFLVNGLTGSGSKAKTIYVGGNVFVGNLSKISWNCDQIFIKGNITTQSSQATLEFKGFEYLETGNMTLNDRTNLIVVGQNAQTSRMNAESIINASSNYCSLNLQISNLWTFSCQNLAINGNSNLSVISNVVKIKGNFTVDEQVDSLLIKTQHFDCTGMTTINNMKNNLQMSRFDDNKPLNVRFEGGYIERDSLGSGKSLIIGEATKPATTVVFGKAGSDSSSGSVSLSGNNGAGLKVYADNIYLDSNNITLQCDNNNLRFAYSGNLSGQKTNMYIRSTIAYRNVSAGTYLAVNGSYPAGLTNPGAYVPPVFPTIPLSSEGSGGNTGGTSGGSSGGAGGSAGGGASSAIKEIY